MSGWDIITKEEKKGKIWSIYKYNCCASQEIEHLSQQPLLANTPRHSIFVNGYSVVL